MKFFLYATLGIITLATSINANAQSYGCDLRNPNLDRAIRAVRITCTVQRQSPDCAEAQQCYQMTMQVMQHQLQREQIQNQQMQQYQIQQQLDNIEFNQRMNRFHR